MTVQPAQSSQSAIPVLGMRALPMPGVAQKPQAKAEPICHDPTDACRVHGGQAPRARGELSFLDQGKDTRTFFVNGIRTSEESAREAITSLQCTTGDEIELIYNPTKGLVEDACEALANLSGIETNISRKAQDRFKSALERGENVKIYAHSQGAAITADALNQIAKDWREQGLKPQEIQSRFAKVEVVGFGAFATKELFPKGVKVEIFNHENDYIPKFAESICEIGKAAKSKEDDFLGAVGNAFGTLGGFLAVNTAQAVGYSVDKAMRNVGAKSSGTLQKDLNDYLASVGCAVQSDHLMVVKDDYTRKHVRGGYISDFADQLRGRFKDPVA